MHGEIYIDSTPHVGTKVQFYIPLKESLIKIAR